MRAARRARYDWGIEEARAYVVCCVCMGVLFVKQIRAAAAAAAQGSVRVWMGASRATGYGFGGERV